MVTEAVAAANTPGASTGPSATSPNTAGTGLLVVNADDWGRTRQTTDMILACVVRGAVSAVSAMVFMEDSERAATVAREREVNAGLHLNFTDRFTMPGCPATLVDRQRTLASYLRRHRLAQVIFHPGLRRSFDYVVKAQLDEFRRTYGTTPERLDGHHHMHLCANVVFGDLLPHGTLVRRNFSFQPGEKGGLNRLYRRVVDRRLSQRHRMLDLFFSLPPFQPWSRLERVFTLARTFSVELETHPVNPEEYRFLEGGEIFRHLGGARIGAPPLAHTLPPLG